MEKREHLYHKEGEGEKTYSKSFTTGEIRAERRKQHLHHCEREKRRLMKQPSFRGLLIYKTT